MVGRWLNAIISCDGARPLARSGHTEAAPVAIPTRALSIIDGALTTWTAGASIAATKTIYLALSTIALQTSQKHGRQ